MAATEPNNELDGPLRTWARDRLQPTLLDRLTDHNPARHKDTASELVISRQQLRQIIMRDLGWLLNATNMESEVDFEFLPDARRSAINFGLPAFSGRHATDVKLETLQAELREAIIQFEPRIVPSTLQVVGVTVEDDSWSAAHNLLMFEIRGQIWSIPYPIEMLLKSSIDLETGSVTLQDQLGDS
ncbi:MAG: type VI secretion system baseplate subunit TssE [Burkholderiaceae bacterium]|jgi:type VI secretion system protein ImpF|nr:type VI secretion system baseplate subunit TssE [Burkholderiaceae bacterium]